MISLENFIEFIKNKELGSFKENVSFKTLTTYKTGGTARLVVFPSDIKSLIEMIKYLKENNISFKIFGNGSNILASDNDYEGVIIKLTKLNNIKIDDQNIEVEAGYNFTVLCNTMCKKGYSGLEFGCGIPATVGGAVYMNAGAYLKDVSTVLVKVDILDENQNIKTLENKDLDFSYRHSIFMEKDWIILKAYFKLAPGKKEEIT